MEKTFRFLFILQIFIGVGAVGGGLMATLFPEGPAGMGPEALKNSPFDNFLIPGIILLTVIGLGHIISGIITYKRFRIHPYATCITGGALIIWIIVQCIMLNTVVLLHIIFFVFGVIEFGIGIVLLFRDNLFPANIVINLYKNIKK